MLGSRCAGCPGTTGCPAPRLRPDHNGLGVGVVVLGGDALPTLASTPRVTDDARLRRAQALAPYEPVGLGIARYLLASKVAGQAHLVLGRFGAPEAQCSLPGTRESFEERSATIADLAEAIKGAETIEEARQLEASDRTR